MTRLAIAILFCAAQWHSAHGLENREMSYRLPRARPEEVGMSSVRLHMIDDIVLEGLRRKRMPGAVVLVARREKVVYVKAFGFKQVLPEEVPMATDTVFDMASITKPVATATSVMVLMDQNKLHPRDLVSQHIPEFGNNGKQRITIYQLLTHQSGLIADNALQDYLDGPQKSFERIYQLKPVAEPGTKFIYSDVGFIVLGELVRRLSGLDVHQFSQKHIFEPLDMRETGFLPATELKARAAPTEQREGTWIQGDVHDPRAYQLGGIAGHAGLFSTADDLAIYGQMMINGGRHQAVSVLSPSVVETMTQAYQVPGALRGLGWDKRSGYSSNRGDLFSYAAFGHGGFTGTVLWIDPELQLQVVFLSNRVHPDGKGLVNPLAGRICTVVAAAITDRNQTPRPDVRQAGEESRQVLTGIDVLQAQDWRVLRGQRVGLITNHTGINRDGVSTLRLLHQSPHVELVALFSPEHGLKGQLDIPHIDDTTEKSTGLRVHSLYGSSRTPSAESLQQVDMLVFDIQDIGTRFYTYISTMGNAMRAAAEHGVGFCVLDRPNPIGGTHVSGPVLDPGTESFVGFHSMAVRHGMTVGEIAEMLNDELKLELNLKVIRMSGWRRAELFDVANLRWVNPSPNMRSLTQAVLYPGIGLLETTNLSVGRGTDTPFEVLGAPWIDPRRLASALNASGLVGVRFVPVKFTPSSSKFAGESCGGVNIVIVDRARFAPVRTGLEIAHQLRRLYPEDWDVSNLNRLLKNQSVLNALLDGKFVDEIELLYQPELSHFKTRRARYLLYD